MITRILYLIYLIEWRISHKGPGFKGCIPVCYEEWQDCELREMMDKHEWYEDNWYYFMVKYLREKESTTF